MQGHIAAEDETCEVTQRYEEEFFALEGALLRRGGALQLSELAQVNPWERYISFKFRTMRLHLTDDRESLLDGASD